MRFAVAVGGANEHGTAVGTKIGVKTQCDVDGANGRRIGERTDDLELGQAGLVTLVAGGGKADAMGTGDVRHEHVEVAVRRVLSDFWSR